MRVLTRTLTLLLAASWSFAAAASDSRTESFSYRLYLSGLKIGKANLTAQIGPDSYVVTAHAKTIGMVGWFHKVDAHAKVAGRMVDGRLAAPSLFEMNSITEERDHFTMRMPFLGDAPSAVEAEPPLRKVHYAADPTRQNGAVDPLTALIAALLPVSAETPCDRTIPVFDGRRRFDIRLDAATRTYEKKGKPHVECAAYYVRRAGFKEKHLAKPDVPFKVAFAITGDGVAKPARLEGMSDFGPVVAVLRKY